MKRPPTLRQLSQANRDEIKRLRARGVKICGKLFAHGATPDMYCTRKPGHKGGHAAWPARNPRPGDYDGPRKQRTRREIARFVRLKPKAERRQTMKALEGYVRSNRSRKPAEHELQAAEFMRAGGTLTGYRDRKGGLTYVKSLPGGYVQPGGSTKANRVKSKGAKQKGYVCVLCGGTGQVPTFYGDDVTTCPDCKGSGRTKNPRTLTVPQKHQLRIARSTLKMSDAGANIMGGPTKAEALEIIKKLTRNPAEAQQIVADYWGKRAPRTGTILDAIHPGSRVTIVDRFGKQHSGRAVMLGPAGWVLNMGGPHGTPGIADAENIVKVKNPYEDGSPKTREEIHAARRKEQAEVKRALAAAGIRAKVSHGRGTAWGWLHIDVLNTLPAHNHSENDNCPWECPHQVAYRQMNDKVVQIAQRVTKRHGDYDGRISIQWSGARKYEPGAAAAPARRSGFTWQQPESQAVNPAGFHPGLLTGTRAAHLYQRSKGMEARSSKRVKKERAGAASRQRAAQALRAARAGGRAPARQEREAPHRSAKRGSLTGDRADVVSALKNLGYTPGSAREAAQSAEGSGFDAIMRSALGRLKRNPKKNAEGPISASVLLSAIQMAADKYGEARVNRKYLGTLLSLVATRKVHIVREDPPNHTIVQPVGSATRKRNVEFGEYSKGIFHPWTMRPVTTKKRATRGAPKRPRPYRASERNRLNPVFGSAGQLRAHPKLYENVRDANTLSLTTRLRSLAKMVETTGIGGTFARDEIKRIEREIGRRRTRSNPNGAEATAKMFEGFHGKPHREVLKIKVPPVKLEPHMAKLGDCSRLMLGDKVKVSASGNATGADAEIAFEPARQPILATDGTGQSLFLIAGDQALDDADLKAMGSNPAKAYADLGPLGGIEYHTRKGFDNFEPLYYVHAFGEDSGVQPNLLYDKLNKRFIISGGEYKVKPDGIVN